MASEPERIQTCIELPEGAIACTVVELVEYLDEDSERRYRFRAQGTESTAMILGLLELTKRDVLATSHFPTDDD